MFFSKLRASSRTILSALLCVFIGLVIGFVVLFSLAYIDKNNTYQKNAEAYTSGQYPRADMLRAKKYLEGGEIGDDVLSHLKGQYGAVELTDVVLHILNDNSSGVKFYTDEQIAAAVAAVDENGGEESTSLFTDAVRSIMLKRYEFTLGDVLSDA